MFVDFNFVHNIGSHLQTFLQLPERRQENFFYNLQITKIPRRQIIHYHHNLLRKSLQLVAFCPCQFKDIRVLFMRHYTGAGSTFIRKFYKAKVLATEHTSVKSHFRNCPGNRSQSKSHITFHLTTPHLRIHHIIIHRIKSQQAGGHLTIERKRRTIPGSRAQRIAVAHFECSLQKHHIVHQTLSIRAKPQAK